MSTIDIQSLTKMYYSIGELSKMLDVNASLLRFWEKEFSLKVSKRNKKGNRLYSVKEIEKISQIYTLVKVNGYTLDGAKKALKSKNKETTEVNEKAVVINKLNGIKKRLIQLKS